MGTDSLLYFPPETRVNDVAEVLAILLGATPEKRYFHGEGPDGGWSCVPSEKLEVQNTSVPQMLCITGTVQGKRVYNMWHWESGQGPAGYRLMTCGMQEPRREALVALADFFGGVLDFNDCDSTDADFTGDLRSKPYRLDANDGAGWDAFQGAMLDLANDPGRPYAWPNG